MRLALGLTLLLTLTLSSSAAIVDFTNRAAWEATVGTFQTEDFEGFGADTEFRTGSVAILGGSVVQGGTGLPPSHPDGNKIDVSTFDFPLLSPNGSTFLYGVSGFTPGLVVQFDFTTPVVGWGADFDSLATTNTFLDVFDQSLTLIGSTGASGVTDTFFGFFLNAGETASRVQIRNSAVNPAFDSFGLDNASFSPVPEPATNLMLGLGLAAFCWVKRRRAAR